MGCEPQALGLVVVLLRGGRLGDALAERVLLRAVGGLEAGLVLGLQLLADVGGGDAVLGLLLGRLLRLRRDALSVRVPVVVVGAVLLGERGGVGLALGLALLRRVLELG